LFPGEIAWEVMEQAELFGEKPVRLIFSSDCIRTVTSAMLINPKEFREFWRISSKLLLKVLWCPDLCVLYVIYLVNPDSEDKITKVFFADQLIGKRIIHSYKKFKPATVVLSSTHKTKIPTKGKCTPEQEEALVLLSTSFRLKISLPEEKFWRAVVIHYGIPKETFIGISPTGIRIVAPSTFDIEMVITLMCVSELKFTTHLGNPSLTLKYFQDVSKLTQIKKMRYHILPVTGVAMVRWYDHCNQFGDEIKTNSQTTGSPIPIPILIIPEKALSPPSHKNSYINSKGSLTPRPSTKKKEKIPKMQKTNSLSLYKKKN